MLVENDRQTDELSMLRAIVFGKRFGRMSVGLGARDTSVNFNYKAHIAPFIPEDSWLRRFKSI